MGLIDKFKRVTGGDEAYDEMYGSDIYDDYGYGYDDGSEGADDQDYGYAADNGASAGVGAAYNNSNPTGGISIGGSSIEMKVVRPETFKSAPQIADHLINKRTVFLNLEGADKETARRLIDFLFGVAYSIDGSLRKVASNAYVITPNNVDVDDAKLTEKGAAKKAEPAPEEAESNTGSQFGDF